MSLTERIGLAALQRMDPENAHRATIYALKAGFGPKWSGPFPVSLRSKVLGLDFAHPLGLAAGFDKNAEAIAPMLGAGLSFVEVGAVTPRPQDGNPRPRLFRLNSDRAIINRFGFNNEGMEAVKTRLAGHRGGIVGLNLGANKDSEDRAADYGTVLRHLGSYVDFATVNVSSPNTEGLRDLQGREALAALLRDTLAVRDAERPRVKLLLKIAPDLSDAQLRDVAEVALETGIDGIVATNTTLARDGLQHPARFEKGGLSGVPLFRRSTDILRKLSAMTEGAVPLIGVGGVASAEDAYAKIRAGASLVQLYSALTWRGPELIREIVTGLARLVERDGHTKLEEAVGADVNR